MSEEDLVGHCQEGLKSFDVLRECTGTIEMEMATEGRLRGKWLLMNYVCVW